MTLQIAVLLPKSDMFPTLAKDFLQGLKLALNTSKHDLDVNFIIEMTGLANEESLLKTCEKLLIEDTIDLAIGFCADNLIDDFTTLFNSYKKPLIRVDLGASVIKNEQVNPYTLHYTLNLWQSAYAAGLYAAENYGKKASFLASAYDGGYHLSAAFAEGFQTAGGEILRFNVGPIDYKQTNFTEMIASIDKEQPDVIFAVFSYKEGVEICKHLADASFNGNIPVMAIPLMTDETINIEDSGLKNVQSVASWSFMDTSDTMQMFQNNFKDAHDENPNVISLLGFEVGQVILHAQAEDGTLPAKISEAIKNRPLKTPRGKIGVNSKNESRPECFYVRDFQFKNQRYENHKIAELNNPVSEELLEKFQQWPNPSWQNPYQCT
tara:strand:- start:31971 stop:33107 length:1137 start_codon:yes stop_codon:yes gene_type:complete